MATQSQPDPTFTESHVYGLPEDALLAVLPEVLAGVVGTKVEKPLPGCFTAVLEGSPERELIVRVEPEREGTRVRLDIRPIQDQRMAMLVVLSALLIIPFFAWLLWAGLRALFAPAPRPQPPEVIAHGFFRGIAQALARGEGGGYRIAAQSDAALGRAEEEPDEENVRRRSR